MWRIWFHGWRPSSTTRMALLSHYSAILAAAFCYRIFWALIISTSFVPDEYYQTIHPANILHAGGKNAFFRNTWEWQDEFRIRSFVPILPYLLFFHIRNTSCSYLAFLSSEIVIVQGSRIINAIIASYSDFAFYMIILRMSHCNVLSICILLTHLLSWSASYCMSRTLANSTETALVITGLFLWIHEHHSGVGPHDQSEFQSVKSLIEGTTKKNKGHMDQNRKGLRKRKSTITQSTGKVVDGNHLRTSEAHFRTHSIAIIVIVLTIHCRPTAVLFWAPLILLRAYQEKNPLTYVLVQYLPGALVSFIFCVAVDSICYGHFTITPYNFFHINVLRNYAVLFYGAKSYAWNFNHGLPVMLGLYTPILLYGLAFTHQPTEAIMLELVSFLYMILLRCVTAHQEYRFLLPCLPFFHIAVGCTIWNIAVWCLPSLGNPTGYPYSFRTYCLSFFFPSIARSAMIISTGNQKDVGHPKGHLKDSRGNSLLWGLAMDRSSVCPPKKKWSAHPCVKMVLLSIIFLMAAAHVGAALYLCTRHQVQYLCGATYSILTWYRFPASFTASYGLSIISWGYVVVVYHIFCVCQKEVALSAAAHTTLTSLTLLFYCTISFLYLTSLLPLTSMSHVITLLLSIPPDAKRGAQAALIQISRAVKREYTRPSASAPSAPCNITVLQLAPCHSFPGFSLLPALIERTGCTVRVFSPDCSPSLPSDTVDLSRITESKKFESSPALFISNEEFWSEWQEANYVVTYNSYVDLLWPVLESKGFTPVREWVSDRYHVFTLNITLQVPSRSRFTRFSFILSLMSYLQSFIC